MTNSRRTTVLVLLALACVALTSCTSAKKTPPEQLAAQAYLDAYGAADSQTAAARTTDSSSAAAALKASLAGLSSGGTGLKGTLKATGRGAHTSNTATISYSASWSLPGVSAAWTYAGTLPMVKQGGAWVVSWSTADIYPSLTAGNHLILKRDQPARAALQASDGTPLFTQTPVVTVGLDPAKVTDLAGVAASLAKALAGYGIAAGDIVAAANAGTPNQFVPVLTLRMPAYEAVKPLIYNLPGVIFPISTELLGPSSRFGQPLLGRVGAATKQLVDASKGRIQAGDMTGLSGLQLAFDSQLAGVAGEAVYSASDASAAVGAEIASVVAAKPGTPVRLTLDRTAQGDADAALAAISVPAAVVAVQPSTGKILAVANSAAADDDIALDGQYSPGSTFKIVTYSAVFASNPGLSASSPVACPATTTVNGQSFENENKFSHPTIPYSAAFAYSCNTSAIMLATQLPATALGTAAASLGLGATWNLGVDSFSGSAPTPVSPNEQAADAIGQGKVLVSPLLMASIAGAAASGKLVAPSLNAATPGTAGAPISAAITTNMNALMRATVAQPGATGTLLGDLPGQVEGKTGTAEFGTDTPPKTHSWFAGARGDLAFAVFVYGGASSGVLALPIAHQFLAAFAG